MVISVPLIAYALTVFVALGIIFIGIRECFQPSVAAHQFGVPLAAPADRDFLAIKASRDIASGAVVLTLLAIGDHRAVAYAVLALTLIPILDGIVVFKHGVFSASLRSRGKRSIFLRFCRDGERVRASG